MSPTARLSRVYNSDNATDMTPDQIMLEDVRVTFETKSKLCIKYPISNLFKLLFMEYNTFPFQCQWFTHFFRQGFCTCCDYPCFCVIVASKALKYFS